MTFADSEPALTAGSLVALATAVLALLAAFGLPLTGEQREAVLGLVAILAPIAVAVLTRPHVVPVTKLPAVLAETLNDG